MGRISHHLLPGRWRRKVNLLKQIRWRESDITHILKGEGERWIHEHRSHGKNQPLLTSWKVKEKGKFISTDQRGRISYYLLSRRWSEKENSSTQIRRRKSDFTYFLEDGVKRWIHQHRSDGENQSSHTRWKVKGKGGEFISTDQRGRINHHLLAGRWRGKVNSSAQITWRKSTTTYSLECEGERRMCQHR